MWLLFACGSAIFAGVTAVLAKIGMQHINSTVATALRTGVVLLFSWLLVLLTGAISGIGAISGKPFLFLILSGCATGASWLCYFQALQLGDVNQVAPIDKSSTILTMLLAFLFLGEALTVQKIICMLLIGAAGSALMPATSPDPLAYILDVAQTHTSQTAIHDEKRMAILCHPFCHFCKFDFYFWKSGNSEH